VPPLSFATPVLAVEASTFTGSVALWRAGSLVAGESVMMGAGREDQLFPAIQRLLAGAGVRPNELGGIVCGEGPGSFTSLRIAAALAKGLAHGAGCALFAVPSLLLAAASADGLPPGRYVVHADALRQERYALPVLVHTQGLVESAGPLARVAEDAVRAGFPAARRIAVNLSPFADEQHVVTPSVSALSRASGAWQRNPVSLEAWEPVYGRLAEAQVKWEERHGMALPEAPAVRS
jgi:tRNA threonylcarbamoyladenosine biosynthesis protein TsaB